MGLRWMMTDANLMDANCIHNKVWYDCADCNNTGVIQMEFTEYVRKPFLVEAVEVTVDNLAEVAEFVGELRKDENDKPYIYVNRRLVPNVLRVWPGYFMTRMGDHIRCYKRKVFLDQFTEATTNIRSWVEFLGGDAPEPAVVED